MSRSAATRPGQLRVSICWDAWFADHRPSTIVRPRPEPGRGERGAARRTTGPVLATGAARGPRLAFPWIALQRWWTAWSRRPRPALLPAHIGASQAAPPSPLLLLLASNSHARLHLSTPFLLTHHPARTLPTPCLQEESPRVHHALT